MIEKKRYVQIFFSIIFSQLKKNILLMRYSVQGKYTLATSMYKNTERNTEKNTENFFCFFFL